MGVKLKEIVQVDVPLFDILTQRVNKLNVGIWF